MKNYNLGIIGCGNMAQAIIKALYCDKTQEILRTEKISLDVRVSDLDGEKLKAMAALGAKTFTNNGLMIDGCDCVLLAIKPQTAKQVLSGLDLSEKLIVSIMAGVSLKTLEEYTGSATLARVMPNLNARIGMSVNAYCGKNLNAEWENFVRILLGSFGSVIKVDESNMNAVTGLTGSAPAFVFMFIKSFIEEGINNGFSPIAARQMALATIIGSAKLVENEAETDINVLIDSVCSKGGTTIEGVNYLREKDMENTVKNAIKKSINRAGELERTI